MTIREVSYILGDCRHCPFLLLAVTNETTGNEEVDLAICAKDDEAMKVIQWCPDEIIPIPDFCPLPLPNGAMKENKNNA